jgi:hypothetical protein
MTPSKLAKILGGLGAVALMSWAGPVLAEEGFAPHQPGVTTGAPNGALPPPGLYGAIDNVIVNGGAHDGSGNNLPVNTAAEVFIPTVLWVPNFQLGGGQVAVALTQPYVISTFGGAVNSIANGLFNTIPSANISWNLQNGFFVSTGVALYLPDGYISNHVVAGTGGQRINGPANIANNFTTFEPGVAVSYLKDGWNFSGNFVVDFNTINPTTNYQSGDLFTADLTATRTFGKFTAGMVGTYQKQISADSGSGLALNNLENGRLANDTFFLEYAAVGPVIAYEFGPVAINARVLVGLDGKNTFDTTFWHLGIFAPF